VDLVDPALPLAEQKARLHRIVVALMQRVEQGADQTGSAYGLFQRAIALENQVRTRTRDLERTLDALNRANADLAAATAAAEAANHAKTRFLAAASHDILAPLGAAKLFLASLEDTDLDPRQARIAESLRSAFASLDTLLAALLEISHLDAPSFDPSVRDLPVMSVLEPLAREFAPLAAAKGVDLSLAPCGARVISDPTWLRRIVQNLVSNAVRYCARGRVLIGCRLRGPDLRIDVIDTGPGIAPDRLAEIFREFHRLDGRLRSADQGMGLGLAIVERASRLLGHPIDIRSEPGRGSRFSVTVPRQRLALPAPEETAGAAPLTDSLILLLAGDRDLRGDIAGRIEGWGASVIAAAHADEAVELIQQLGVPPDLMIIDTGDAAETDAMLATLRALFGATIPAIRLVGAGDDDGARWTGGIDAAVAKPVRPHRLRALLGGFQAGRACRDGAPARPLGA